jgi:hypothetical protein
MSYDLEYCGVCDAPMDWETCPECGGDGGFGYDRLQFEDPFWYEPGDWEECEFCDGEGGFNVCTNAQAHQKIIENAENEFQRRHRR